MAFYQQDPPKPELKVIIIKCNTEDQASQVFDRIIDEFEDVWPFIAYDDGFGHYVQVKPKEQTIDGEAKEVGS